MTESDDERWKNALRCVMARDELIRDLRDIELLMARAKTQLTPPDVELIDVAKSGIVNLRVRVSEELIDAYVETKAKDVARTFVEGRATDEEVEE